MAEISPLAVEDLVKMAESDRRTLARFAADRGCATPAEEFIRKLVRFHGEYPVTPEFALRDVKELRENFESAIETARMLVRQYPELILGENCGNSDQQMKALKEGEHSNDAQQQAFQLESARDCIRRYPSLFPAEEMPEPRKGIVAEFEAERAAEGVSLARNRPEAARRQR